MKYLLAAMAMTTMLSHASFAEEAAKAPAAVVASAEAKPMVEAVTTVVAEPKPSEAPKVISALEKVEKSIPLDVAAWVLMLITMIVELLVRFIPTMKPRSLLLLVSYGFNLLGSIFTKASNVLDKIVQNLKEDKAK